MKVKELIEELKKCNPDDIVMYNFENAFTNDNFEIMHDLQERHECEFDCAIDDVAICSGTLKGFVFLREDLLEE